MTKMNGALIITLLTFSGYVLIVVIIYACEITKREIPSSRVPQNVLSSYRKIQHPDTGIRWYLEKGLYVVKWIEDEKKFDAKFDAEGKLITN